MINEVGKLFSASQIIDIDGRPWLLVPVYEWVAEMMTTALTGRNDAPDEKKLASQQFFCCNSR